MIIASWQSVLTFALLLFLLLPLGRLPQGYRLSVLFALLLVALVPLSTGLTLAGLLRGLTDDLATTTLIWLVIAVSIRLGYVQSMSATEKWPLWLGFGLLGLVLYPAAMGVGMFDTYRWGYHPRLLVMVVGILTLAFLLARAYVGILMLALASLAYLLDLKPSNNYWDYLLDPFLVIYCLGALVLQTVRILRRRARPMQPAV
ncbi:MAG: hypothetical protein CVV07_01655 [Gammaproteobacteria bacterium HGW-Gammaproteobacteria-11]|nr:MAG: hypothetical protein CVV07_01655 [Gammaproteobacteria bacterium HGW-Gammaproteobacteria-11]